MSTIATPTAPSVFNRHIADIAAARKVGQEFESVFLGQMVSHAFSGIGKDPLTGGAGSDLYGSMLQDEYGKAVARSGGLGIADAVVRQLIKSQEKQS
jgi:Rod binding domain-containing protein